MKTAVVALLLAVAGLANAQTAYRWVDQDGKVHYGDRPPPPKATREIQEKRLAAPMADNTAAFALRDATSKHPVTLFISAECGAVCQEGKDFLGKRGIPYQERVLSSPEEIAELRALLGGADVVVPVLKVGTKVSKGFLAGNWASTLDAAGYPKSAAR